MSLIQRLVRFRLDNFIEETGIDLNASLDILDRTLQKYFNSDRTCEYFYWLIKKLVWNNIITYEAESTYNINGYKVYTNILYIGKIKESHVPFVKYPKIDYNAVLNRYELGLVSNKDSNDNMDKMETLITTYFMLINIIMKDTITDICDEIKKWMYYIRHKL